tara:strand:- start:1320 stop:2480 length:1161 start_codon:yes stop_codon:yes gene_type:complete
MLNEKNNIVSNGFLTSQITYHKEFAPFARRPLTTFLIETASNWLDIPLGKAFVLVNFFLLFLSGILLFRLSKVMDSGLLKGIINLIIYFLSFSVLFAFFPPIFTYDEPLQYCFIFAGLTSFLKRQWAGYVLWFTAAMIARENSAFLIFGLALSVPGLGQIFRKVFSFAQLRHYLLIVIPVLLYFVFLIFFIETHGLWGDTQSEFLARFSNLKENFRDMRNTVETIISFVITLGVFVYFLFISAYQNDPSPKERRFANAFVISCVLNTLVVLIAAFSRESRLFALPLLFIWPIMAQYCFKEIRLLLAFKTYWLCFANWRYCIAFGILTTINYIISFVVYVPSFPSSDNYFNEYLFLVLELMSLHFLLRHFTKRNLLSSAIFHTGLPI